MTHLNLSVSDQYLSELLPGLVRVQSSGTTTCMVSGRKSNYSGHGYMSASSAYEIGKYQIALVLFEDIS